MFLNLNSMSNSLSVAPVKWKGKNQPNKETSKQNNNNNKTNQWTNKKPDSSFIYGQ